MRSRRTVVQETVSLCPSWVYHVLLCMSHATMPLLVSTSKNMRHGPAPIEEHCSDCPKGAREQLFDGKHEEILWLGGAAPI
jgi:hypothetical protein